MYHPHCGLSTPFPTGSTPPYGRVGIIKPFSFRVIFGTYLVGTLSGKPPVDRVDLLRADFIGFAVGARCTGADEDD